MPLHFIKFVIKATDNCNRRVTPLVQIVYMNSITEAQKEKVKTKSYLNK